MSLNIPNAPNANLFKGGYNKSVALFAFCFLIVPMSHATTYRFANDAY